MKHRTEKLIDGYAILYKANSEEYRRELIAWLDYWRPGMSERVKQAVPFAIRYSQETE